MENFAKDMSDADIADVIVALDRLNNPMHKRFEGDDTAIVSLMNRMGLNQTVVDKLLIGYVVAREASARGLQIARPNVTTAAFEEDEPSSPAPGR